ncbi:ubiquinol-cytochrome c reductase iron-sulfur subunit [Aquipuribacter nitratireducens]|uniref:Cytochrome bc1 complex Rieske iron-sulfur subunit n=1 Tax=Aquipuribacter nitratireducens TaxID=650104 RepID=A0ABW0GIQ3_9MICO
MADDTFPCSSRRSLLRALAGVGVTTIAAGVLAACGNGEEDAVATDAAGAGDGTAAGATGGSGAGTEAGTDTGSQAGTGTTAGGTDASAEATVPLADVPVGEAVVVDALGTRLVVAQPTAGEVVAFSAACTHQGTTVEAAGGLELFCPNHGSRFDAGDGAAVVAGPAPTPLPSVPARVEGDQVVLTPA